MTGNAGDDPALAQLFDMVRAIFPAPIGIGVTDPRLDYPPLWAAELEATTGMRPARLREFTAGRHAARLAMAQLGRANRSVPMGVDRAPIWPKGLQGSLTHCETAAVVVMTLGQATLGIDLETNSPIDRELVPEFCNPDEMKWLSDQPPDTQSERALIIFSAKEAVYKAQYPITLQVIDFLSISITLDVREGCFLGRFNHSVGPIQAGQKVHGGIGISKDHVLTGISLDQPRPGAELS